MEHGLDQTLLSYGVDETAMRKCERRPSKERLRKLLDVVPETHRAFLRNLQSSVEYADIFVLHAWWPPDTSDQDPPLAEQIARNPTTRQSIIWGRYTEPEIYGPKVWKRTGLFGHTAVMNYTACMVSGRNIPIRGPNMVLLDTGVALSPLGRLTAYCVETRTFLQVDREGNVVEDL
jgi:hypothetical protein